MQRRQFFTNTALASIAAPFSTMLSASDDAKPHLIKPAALRAGMRVAIITPSSPPAEVKLENANTNLTALGLQITPGQFIREKYGYLAGTDEQRIQDIHAAFANPAIDAIWCIRGGYGAARLLPQLDYDLIKKHPKLLIGYSDITALHIAIHQRTGLVTCHGQVAGGDFPEDTTAHIRATLFEGKAPHSASIFEMEQDSLTEEYSPFVITPGKAQGRLMGGNLSLLAAMTGTAFAPVFKDKLAFIEEVGEAPYRVDRLLTQLLQGTDLAQARGIALGVFTDCKQKSDSPTLTLSETLKDRLGNLGIPVMYGLPFGHISRQCVMPLGVETAMDTSTGKLTFLEPAVRFS